MENQSYKQQIGGLIFVAVLIVTSILSSKPATALDPLVDTGVSPLASDGKHVSVNIPTVFHMNLDTRGPSKGYRLSESVLSGLVKINMDRTRGADGKLKGPIEVKVAGATVYSNHESA